MTIIRSIVITIACLLGAVALMIVNAMKKAAKM